MNLKYNTPFTLTFVIFALLFFFAKEIDPSFALTLDKFKISPIDFSLLLKDKSAFLNLFLYPLGDTELARFLLNLTMLLLIAPVIEEKYGFVSMLAGYLFITSITSFIAIFLPNIISHAEPLALSNMTGLVISYIFVNFFIKTEENDTPISLIFVFCIYLYIIFFSLGINPNNILNLSYLIGGIIGAFILFIFPSKKYKAYYS